MHTLYIIDLDPSLRVGLGETASRAGFTLMRSKGYYRPVVTYDEDDRDTEFQKWINSLIVDRGVVSCVVVVCENEKTSLPAGAKCPPGVPLSWVHPSGFSPKSLDIVWRACDLHLQDGFFVMTQTEEEYQASFKSEWLCHN